MFLRSSFNKAATTDISNPNFFYPLKSLYLILSISVETMPRDFSKAKTSVFWDVEDFPNPDGRSIYEIIKSALEKEGYHGEVSISAYGEKKPDNLDDDGVIAFVPKRGKYARLIKMLLDIALWSIDIIQPGFPVPAPVNLMVITKNIPEDTEFAGYLGLLPSHICNVLLVVAHDCAPEEAPLPNVYTIWWQLRCALLATKVSSSTHTALSNERLSTDCTYCTLR